MPSFQQSGKDFSDSDLSKSSCKGLQTVYMVDFNILWLIQSGPIALFTGKTDIISVTSFSSITISLRLSSHCKNISGRD